jgi:hypothetical protein
MTTKVDGQGNQEVEVVVFPNCDICFDAGLSRSAKYDAKTKTGPWAYLCETHYQEYGIGLGTGLGQKLVLKKIPEPRTIMRGKKNEPTK